LVGRPPSRPYPKALLADLRSLVAAASDIQRKSVPLPPRGMGDASPGWLLLGQ
jgi:epoxyqueuosine reductase QueG